MELIIGHKNENHITSSQVAQILRTIGIGGIGDGGFNDSPTINGDENFKSSYDGNTITILGGVGMVQGRAFRIAENDSETVELEPNSAGKARKGFVVARYTVSEEIEDINLIALYGEDVDNVLNAQYPQIAVGNIDDGDSPVDVAILQFIQQNGVITELAKAKSKVKSIASIKTKYDSDYGEFIQFGDFTVCYGKMKIADIPIVVGTPNRYTKMISFPIPYKEIPFMTVSLAEKSTAQVNTVPVYSNVTKQTFDLDVYRTGTSTAGSVSWLAVGIGYELP